MGFVIEAKFTDLIRNLKQILLFYCYLMLIIISLQTKTDWNGQKWIRFVRVKFRFWSF